jgi:hypothetical protein
MGHQSSIIGVRGHYDIFAGGAINKNFVVEQQLLRETVMTRLHLRGVIVTAYILVHGVLNDDSLSFLLTFLLRIQ